MPGGSLWTAGPGSFIDEMITLSGGTNIVGDKTTGAWVEISLEYVISSDPDIIVIAGGSHGISINDVAASVTSWKTLTAVKNNKIYTVDSDLGVRPGPRIIQGFEEMAKLIHPELFK
ncbi:MAG: ABC transporter substrate-binding protein [Chloroflexi bacterium]|nr:ABC transporter substrate-binding protein [Chloroflexota bacterium]